jgi:hypothetical protein
MRLHLVRLSNNYVYLVTIHTLQARRIGVVEFNVNCIRGVEIARTLTTYSDKG